MVFCPYRIVIIIITCHAMPDIDGNHISDGSPFQPNIELLPVLISVSCIPAMNLWSITVCSIGPAASRNGVVSEKASGLGYLLRDAPGGTSGNLLSSRDSGFDMLGPGHVISSSWGLSVGVAAWTWILGGEYLFGIRIRGTDGNVNDGT